MHRIAHVLQVCPEELISMWPWPVRQYLPSNNWAASAAVRSTPVRQPSQVRRAMAYAKKKMHKLDGTPTWMFYNGKSIKIGDLGAPPTAKIGNPHMSAVCDQVADILPRCVGALGFLLVCQWTFDQPKTLVWSAVKASNDSPTWEVAVAEIWVQIDDGQRNGVVLNQDLPFRNFINSRVVQASLHDKIQRKKGWAVQPQKLCRNMDDASG